MSCLCERSSHARFTVPRLSPSREAPWWLADAAPCRGRAHFYRFEANVVHDCNQGGFWVQEESECVICDNDVHRTRLAALQVMSLARAIWCGAHHWGMKQKRWRGGLQRK